MLRSFSKYTGDQVFPGTEGLAQTNSIYPFLDNLTAGLIIFVSVCCSISALSCSFEIVVVVSSDYLVSTKLQF